MQLFIDILTGITLPILGLAALGYVAQRRIGFDIPTLTRMQLYVILPGALIYFLATAKLPVGAALPILWFSLVLYVFLFALGWSVAALIGMSREGRGLMGVAAFFSNSGNYGIPLIQLTFPEDYLLYQTVVLSLHSLIIAPVALLVFGGQGHGKISLWRTIFGSPLLPAVALGFLLNGFGIALPAVAAVPLKLLSEALTPTALLLLGVQLATIDGKVGRGPLAAGTILRLVVAPGAAWALAAWLGFPPGQTAFLVVSAAAPVGVLLAIFATEYKSEPGLASMMVFLSTILSAAGVTGWVYAVRYAGLQ